MTHWDDRYRGEGYRFGTEPAQFLRAHAGHIAPGSRVLCVADGEGRNSVWLAGQGHRVTAFDPSGVALEKAARLAADRGATVEVAQATAEDWDWSQPFDAVVAIFVQFAPPAMRDAMFAGFARALVPGGVVLIHGYHVRHLQPGYGRGGSKDPLNLYTPDLLRAAFPGWDVLVAADHDADLAEGEAHVGRSALVDFVARKP
ncbi:MAG: class I SAM-dependent methyltransferase [Rhodobacteraceae bacterium]|jgi:cyclopropane fatty-acyl-phospholipid synthase-like methyltransferase|nr:class I SAM-dependent methyltransferase [Paracoccaceae bacterium]